MLWAVARRSLCLGLSRCVSPALCQTWSLSPACPLHGSAGQGCQEEPLKHWALFVSPFTCLRAQLRASCSISVSPLDPHAFPEADRAFITLHGVSEGRDTALDHLCHVCYDDESRELSITGGGGDSCDLAIQVPIKSSLFITTEGRGHVSVRKMECDICKVSTQQGNCTLHSVKGHQIEVRSSGGLVTGLGTIHGNVDIVTSGESAVDVKKLQGTTMNVSSEHGFVKVKAIYAESSSISSSTGRVELGHVHGDELTYIELEYVHEN